MGTTTGGFSWKSWKKLLESTNKKSIEESEINWKTKHIDHGVNGEKIG